MDTIVQQLSVIDLPTPLILMLIVHMGHAGFRRFVQVPSSTLFGQLILTIRVSKGWLEQEN